MIIFRSSHQRCSVKKGVLRNFAKFTGKHLCQSLFFNEVAGGACNFIKKEILAPVFSCEFCEIPKNTFFTEHVLVTASEYCLLHCQRINNLLSLKQISFAPMIQILSLGEKCVFVYSMST